MRSHMGVRLRQAEALMRELMANLGRLENEEAR
jgi:hypothetical protein